MKLISVGAIVAVAGLAGAARADCPVDVDETPPLGLMSPSLAALDPEMRVASAPDGVAVDLGGAAGTLVDAGHAVMATSAGGQVAAHFHHVAACVSADGQLADTRGGEASATLAFPFLVMGGIQVGVVADVNARVSLLARREYLRAPLDRRELRVAGSVLDLAITDGAEKARAMLAPFTLAFGAAHQEAGAMDLARATYEVDFAGIRVAVEDAEQRTHLDFFAISLAGLDGGAGVEDIGFLELGGEHFEAGGTTHLLLRGGLVSTDYEGSGSPPPMLGPGRSGDTKGFRAEGGYTWTNGLAVHVEGGRGAYVANDASVALEDRASAGGGFHRSALDVKLDGFVARTQPFDDPGVPWSYAEGVRLAVACELGRGFLVSVQGELAHGGYATSTDPDPPTRSARAVAQLAWHFHAEHTRDQVGTPRQQPAEPLPPPPVIDPAM